MILSIFIILFWTFLIIKTFYQIWTGESFVSKVWEEWKRSLEEQEGEGTLDEGSRSRERGKEDS